MALIQIPASKSILLRLFMIQHAARDAKVCITGENRCDDVCFLREGLQQLQGGKPIECGASAAVLRFLAFAASRIPGSHLLTGTKRLFERPHEELISLLQQLDVDATLHIDSLTINSKGWKEPSAPILLPMLRSSQFASGLLLSAWNLPFPLKLEVEAGVVSRTYFQMTLELVRRSGMKVLENEEGFTIPTGAEVKPQTYDVEPDAGCAYAVAALQAVTTGVVSFDETFKESLQPDSIFPEILERLNVTAKRRFTPLKWSFRECPDLFPVTAVLCGLATGTSKLVGAPHLAYKESNRLTKTAELLQKMGCAVRKRVDGLEIMGVGFPPTIVKGAAEKCPSSALAASTRPATHIRVRLGRSQPPALNLDIFEQPQKRTLVLFDPDEDHRLVMAAAIANAAGHRLQIRNRECVRKSFPEFLQIAKEYL